MSFCSFFLEQSDKHDKCLWQVLTPDDIFPVKSRALHSRSHIAGSFHGAGMLLTSAFYDQVHHITWYQFYLDKISTAWDGAATESTTVIEADWHIVCSFTRAMWKQDAIAFRVMQPLHSKVRSLYILA